MLSLKLKSFFKILSFIIFQLILLLLANKTGIDVFYFFLLLFSVFFVIDVVLMIINFLLIKKIKISRKVQDSITEGEVLNIELSVDNQGFLPFVNVSLNDFLGCAEKEKKVEFFVNWVNPRGSFKIKYDCLCNQRGRYILGPISITFYGFLGLFYIRRVVSTKKVIYVYVKTFNIKTPPPLTKGHLPWFGLETTFASGEEDEFYGLREYQRGDPLKWIHWLTVAKKNKMVVRKFQRSSFYQASIMFLLNQKDNLGVGRETVFEYIIKIAASLTKYFIEKDICVEILAQAGMTGYFPSNKGSDYLEEIFKFYAEAQTETKITMEEFLPEYEKHIPERSTLFYFLTEKNLEMLIDILYLKERDISVVALIIISSTFSSSPPPKEEIDSFKDWVQTRLLGLKTNVLFFSKGDNLEAIFAERRE